MLAVFLSILFPGLGQFYYGKNIRGIVMFALALTPLYLGALIWSVFDVVKLNQKGLTPKFDRKEALWVVILLFIVVPLSVGIMIFGAVKTFNWHTQNFALPKATQVEGSKIVRALEDFRGNYNQYPENLHKLLDGRPMRKGWLTDSWGQSYIYTLSDKGDTCKLTSKGKDRVLDTDDDIVFEPPLASKK